MDGPQAMQLGEGLLRELTRAGLSPAQASRAAYTLIVQVIGFAALVRHPGAAQLFMNAPMDGPQAMELGEGLLRELTRAGLPPAQASRATYSLIVQVIGFAALAMAETDGTVPLAPESERVAGRRAALELVPPESHPLTAATRDTAAAWVGEAQLRWSVDRLLDGFAALVEAP
jgi:hypothetical protein